MLNPSVYSFCCVPPCVADVGVDCAVCHQSNKRRLPIFVYFTAVCQFIRTIFQKPTQLGSPNLTDKCSNVPHDESWKSIYFRQKKSKVKVSRQNNAGVGLVSVGFSVFQYQAKRMAGKIVSEMTYSMLSKMQNLNSVNLVYSLKCPNRRSLKCFCQMPLHQRSMVNQPARLEQSWFQDFDSDELSWQMVA